MFQLYPICSVHLKYHYPKCIGFAKYIETLPALLYQFTQFIAVHDIKFQFDKLQVPFASHCCAPYAPKHL
jgi:hypothetical protein